MQGYNFTNRVRQALADARQEAIRLRHQDVTTQHLLLALLREKSTVAASVIESFGVKLDAVGQELEGTVTSGPEPYEPRTDVPYSPRAKKVLELAMDEARGLNHSYVGTHHLLLGLIREEKGVAAQVLTSFGMSIDDARTHVLDILSSGKQDDDGLQRRPASAAATEMARTDASAPVRMVGYLIPPTAGSTWMAASIVEALLRDAGVAGVFAAQGIDAGTLVAALRTAALRPPPGDAPGTAAGDSPTPSPPAA
jgi:ATP-dependent Clp protease ATP-binding subunit ClpA